MMGKRSNFKRNPRDFYETPEKAVVPLIAHLDDCVYIDPCCGNDAIPKHISLLNPYSICVGRFDLYSNEYNRPWLQWDARTKIYPELQAEMFITNPPWSRDVLHSIIDNLASQLPTWLLFDADWMHTKQAIPYLKYCEKIVSVGRVSWMGNGVSGMDNCCWYLFDKNYDGLPQLVGRAA